MSERSGLRLRPEVLRAKAYVPAWPGLDRTGYVRLDLNECTRPLSTRVADALTAHIAARGVHSYPDGEADLAEAIAAYCGTTPDCILPTNGSDQAIDLVLRAFLAPGGRMLTARPGFSIFTHVAELAGATIQGVPYGPHLEFPYEEFRLAAATRPDLTVFINPNNPTGTPVDPAFIEEIAMAYPELPVVVDEAYAEFTGVSSVALVADRPNVIVLRTFSKAFAMAGLRLGYVVAQPALTAELVKIRNPFDVNALAAVAGRAQLADVTDMRRYTDHTMRTVKPMILDFFARYGIEVHPGAANFVLVRPADLDLVMSSLFEAKILVRRTSESLAGMFRMSLGTDDEMAHFTEVYRQLLRKETAG